MIAISPNSTTATLKGDYFVTRLSWPDGFVAQGCLDRVISDEHSSP